jgi:hypothetical protein
MNLIIQYYTVNYTNQPLDLIVKRQKEINMCLDRNLRNNSIQEIHILFETMEDEQFMHYQGFDKSHPNYNKIKPYFLGTRLTYQSILNYASLKLPNKWCIYMHADLYLNQIEPYLLEELNTKSEKNVYALTAHHPTTCSRQGIKCGCTRQWFTKQGLRTPTIDGFVFKSPLDTNMITKANHIVHRMGAENRMIAIFKEYGYKITCPHMLFYTVHQHLIKIFAPQHSTWVEMSGECKPLEYYQKINAQQSGLPYEEKIVGGGIPFYDGTVEIVDNL